MTDVKKLKNFFNSVMMYLRHYDWDIEFGDKDSYCWKKDKKITINLNYKGDIRQIILHEIAHIDTAKYCNQKHNPDFWKNTEYLTRKFLKTKLDINQIKHKKYMSNGFYRLCYKTEI